MNPQSELQGRLLNDLKHIVRARDPYFASGGHLYVREYIRNCFSQFGEVVIHEFEVRDNIHQNLVLHIKSSNHTAGNPILIGAHYDAVPGTPGADDNATGMAVLLEMARSQ